MNVGVGCRELGSRTVLRRSTGTRMPNRFFVVLEAAPLTEVLMYIYSGCLDKSIVFHSFIYRGLRCV